MREIAAIVSVAVTVAASVACGGGNGNDGAAPERATEPQALERAESIVLGLSDFPDGWRTAPPGAENEQAEEELRICTGVYSAFTITGEAQSDFAMAETAQVSSEVAVWESEEEATDFLATLLEGTRSEAADDCWKEFFEESALGEDFVVGDVAFSELSFTRPDVDEAGAWQIVVPLRGKPGGEAEGVSVTAYYDLVEFRQGDVVALVRTFDAPTAFDAELRDKLVRSIADRMSE